MKGNNVWKTNKEGIKNLKNKKRIDASAKGRLGYVRYFDDFPAQPITSLWTDAVSSFMSDKIMWFNQTRKLFSAVFL